MDTVFNLLGRTSLCRILSVVLFGFYPLKPTRTEPHTFTVIFWSSRSTQKCPVWGYSFNSNFDPLGIDSLNNHCIVFKATRASFDCTESISAANCNANSHSTSNFVNSGFFLEDLPLGSFFTHLLGMIWLNSTFPTSTGSWLLDCTPLPCLLHVIPIASVGIGKLLTWCST